MKTTQKIMFWFLPLIVIGGLFYPILGYIAVGMMAFLLILARIKRSRFWCANYCPRGSFLDGILSHFSLKRPIPKLFSKKWFRWFVLFSLVTFLISRIISTGGGLFEIGGVFVSMCLITTIIAIFLGVFTKERAWCVVCPMGTLQGVVGKKKK